MSDKRALMRKAIDRLVKENKLRQITARWSHSAPAIDVKMIVLLKQLKYLIKTILTKVMKRLKNKDKLYYQTQQNNK